MVGEKPVYVPLSWLAAGILVCLAVAVIALLRLYLNRKGVLDWEADQRIKKSWPKLLVLHIFILLVTFASLWLMQFLTGFRVPWLAHPGPHILYAFFFFIFGVWLALQILRRWRLRKNAFFYFVRSFGYFLFLVIIPWSAFGPRLAFFPAVGLLLISLAALVRWTWLKGILWLASPVLMFRLLVLPEYYQFIYRGVGGMGLAGVRTTPAFALMHLVLILFMTFWSQPFLLGLAAVYRSARGDLLGLKRFRRPAFLVPVGMLLILGAVFLLNLPSYMKPWEQVISVTQEFDSEKNKTQVEFSSGDFLRGVTADIAGQMQTIEERECVKTIDYPLEMNWLKVNPEVQIEDQDKERMVSLKLALAMEKSPYTVSLLLKSDRLLKIDQANIRYRLSKNQVRVSWTCFPERSLRPELHLRLPKEARLDADITVSFLELPVRISAAGKNKFFIYRSQIKKRVELVKTPAAAKKS
jgi:hypothetical protein